MKHGIYTVIALVLLTSCGAAKDESMSQTDSIRAALDAYLAIYPEARYQDVYKNFMQDYFGPGHLLADTARAAAGIRGELANVTDFYGPIYEPAGYKTNFYRVNLSIVADSTVAFPAYFDAFVRSVSDIVPPTPRQWRAEWRLIDSVLLTTGYSYPGLENDRAEIFNRLDHGNYVAHHSTRFNDTYHVHYRIMSRSIFEKEILPLLPPDSVR